MTAMFVLKATMLLPPAGKANLYLAKGNDKMLNSLLLNARAQGSPAASACFVIAKSVWRLGSAACPACLCAIYFAPLSMSCCHDTLTFCACCHTAVLSLSFLPLSCASTF
eukprot:1018428-Pelagomonas_calceolata.AAC.4